LFRAAHASRSNCSTFSVPRMKMIVEWTFMPLELDESFPLPLAALFST